MSSLDVINNRAYRNRSNSSIVTRTRSRSNSFKPVTHDGEAGRTSSPLVEQQYLDRLPNFTVNGINGTAPGNNGEGSYRGPTPKNTSNNELSPYTAEPSSSNLSVIDQEIKPVKSRNGDTGVLSSILNIAHTTANLIHKSDKSRSSIQLSSDPAPEEDEGEGDNKSTFSKKLDFLISDRNFKDDSSQTFNRLAENVSPTNIHFAPTRESPINTLGQGSLSLDDFENSKKDPVVPESEMKEPEAKRLGRRSLNVDTSTVLSDPDQDSVDDSEFVPTKVTFASSKRNKEFHQIFKQLPKNDRLIDDFSCALSKDILVQGKMYLSQKHICFKSNILGWVTNILIPLQEVIQIEKRSTAVLFPNGMIIKTLYQKYTFATFISRDATFKLLTNVWHQVLSNTNDGDQTDEKDADSDGYGEDEEDDDAYDDEIDLDGFDEKDDDALDEMSSSNSEDPIDEDLDNTSHSEDTFHENKHKQNDTSGPTSGGEFFKLLPAVGPLTHEPTTLDYEKQSGDTFIIEDEFKAPVGVVFNLLFGKDNSYYVKILKNQKNIEIEEDKIVGVTKEGDSRNYKYVKPLGGSIGPKQTSCIITDKVLQYDLNKSLLVEQTTSTPDVPSGNAFKIRTRIYLYWGPNNGTKLYVVTNIEWLGKSWIKGPIEKGSIEGQKESMKILAESVNEFISREGGGRKRRSTRRNTKKEEVKTIVEPSKEPAAEKTLYEKWGDFIESIGSNVPIPFIPSLVTGYIIVILLVFIIIQVYNFAFGPKTQPVAPKGQYIFVSSIQNNLDDRVNVMNHEQQIWNWINKVTRLNPIKNNADYNTQEIEEVVRLTQLKLDQLNGLLNSS